MILRAAFIFPQILMNNDRKDASKNDLLGSLSPVHGLIGRQDRLDDIVVTRAATNVALQLSPHSRLIKVPPMTPNHIRCRHDHARRAKPALKPVVLIKGHLNGMKISPVGHPLNRAYIRPIRLGGEHRASLHRLAIHMHNTRPALRRITPNMRPRKVQIFPQKINQQRPTLNSPSNSLTINNHTHNISNTLATTNNHRYT